MHNNLFLRYIFGPEVPFVHVTDFTNDPADLPGHSRFLVWRGDRLENYKFLEQSNQYFTISLFNQDGGKSRRRKDLFKQTNVIVIDDVYEKISKETAETFPTPTYMLETSPGSEQWGYVLETPCTERDVVENLLIGLSKLTKDGKDPGMTGVTRYARLPGGWNLKKSKNNGVPFKVILKSFDMFRTINIFDFAEQMQIDISKKSTISVNYATDIPEHPIFSTPIKIKHTLSSGRFDITCPWVSEHTNEADNGTAVFTNQDGTLGFKCHHGHCEGKNISDLIRYLNAVAPDFEQEYNSFIRGRLFSDILFPPSIDQTAIEKKDPFLTVIDKIKEEPLNSEKARQLAKDYLREVDKLSKIDQDYYLNELCDVMRWTKTTLAGIIKDCRNEWYKKKDDDILDLYSDFVFVREQNVLFNTRTRIFFTPDAFSNSYADIDPDARKNALVKGFVQKVDRLDFLPGAPRIFEESGIVYGNSWLDRNLPTGKLGDCSPWLNHFDVLGWGQYKTHILQFMAYTIQYPQTKINHIVLFGGLEGIGKDFLLTPLIKAMGHYSKTVPGSFLTLQHNEYMLRSKHLHINETELGDHKKAAEVAANIKPLAASPPDTLQVNPKHMSPFEIRNVVNVTMSTNSRTPLKINGPSRRLYPIWSDLSIRDEGGELRPEWREYFKAAWYWMNHGGWEYCVYFLKNCVDLSEFNPGEAPPVTEFLREITEDNTHPAEQTIKAFLEARIGAFRSDIITTEDAINTLRSGVVMAENLLYIEAGYFTPVRFGRIASGMSEFQKLRGKNGEETVRFWSIRNHTKYQALTQKEVHDEYIKQSKSFR